MHHVHLRHPQSPPQPISPLAATHNQNRILEFMVEFSYQCLVAATNNLRLSCGHMDVFSFDYMLDI